MILSSSRPKQGKELHMPANSVNGMLDCKQLSTVISTMDSMILLGKVLHVKAKLPQLPVEFSP